MDCSSPGSSVHGILQARILEWVVEIRVLLIGVIISDSFVEEVFHGSPGAY